MPQRLSKITSISDLLFKINKDKRYEYLTVVAYDKGLGRSIMSKRNDYFTNKENIKQALDWVVGWRAQNGYPDCKVIADHINLFFGEIERRFPDPVSPLLPTPVGPPLPPPENSNV